MSQHSEDEELTWPAPQPPRGALAAQGSDAMMETETGGGRTESRRRFWDVLYRYRVMAVGLVAACVGIAAALTWLIQPWYVATGSVIVGRRSHRWARLSATARWHTTNTDRLIQTEISVLRSRAVASRVIRQQHLMRRDPEIRSGLTGLRRAAAAARQPMNPAVARQIAIGIFRSNLSAAPASLSREVKVSFGSHNPRVAAQAVNATIQEFIAYSLASRFRAGQQASSWLEKQLRGVRQQVRRDQQEVVAFQLRHAYTPLVVPGGQQNVMLQQLAMANEQWTTAQAASVTDEALARSYAQAPELLPDKLRPPALSAAESDAAAARKAYDKVAAIYQPQFPLVLQARARRGRAEQRLAAVRASMRHRLAARAQAARAQAAALGGMLAKLRKQTAGESATQMQYQVLNERANAEAQLYHDLLGKLQEAGLMASLPTSNVRPLDPANPPLSPAYPHLPVNLGLGLLVGLAAAGIGVGARYRWEDRILQSADAHAGDNRLWPLGIIPAYRGGPQAKAGQQLEGLHASARRLLPSHGQVAEYYSKLGANILSRVPLPASVLITSASPNEGKTTTLCNLGLALARQGWRTLIVDADVRRPACHEFFAVENLQGLLAAQEGRAVPPLPVAPGLDLMPCERAVAATLRPRQLPALLRQWQKNYDLMLIDSPPGNLTADVLLLAHMVSGVVVVLRWGSTTMSEARRLNEELLRGQAPILGTVLNGADPNAPEFRYYRRHQGYYPEAIVPAA